VDLVRVNPAVFAKALLPMIPGFEAVDVSLLGQPTGGGQAGGTPGQAPPTPPATPADPGIPAEPSGPQLNRVTDRLAVACDAALERTLERGASRVVAAIRGNGKDTSLIDRIASARDQIQVFALLRPDELAGLKLGRLFDGAWDRLYPKAIEWVTTALEGDGIAAEAARDRAVLVAMSLREELDAYLAAYLHRQLPRYPNGLRIPDELVRRSLDAAGASVI
jgi:hypothetical protein